MSRHIGVFTTPAATMFTRTGASSNARPRVSPSIADRMLAATAQPGPGRAPAVPEVNTIEPPGRMFRQPCLAAVKAPQKRSSKKRRASATSVSSTRPSLSASPAV